MTLGLIFLLPPVSGFEPWSGVSLSGQAGDVFRALTLSGFLGCLAWLAEG